MPLPEIDIGLTSNILGEDYVQATVNCTSEGDDILCVHYKDPRYIEKLKGEIEAAVSSGIISREDADDWMESLEEKEYEPNARGGNCMVYCKKLPNFYKAHLKKGDFEKCTRMVRLPFKLPTDAPEE